MIRTVRVLGWLCVSVVAASPAAAQEMFVFPQQGQDQAQQDADRGACHVWAVNQSGFDPTMARTTPPPSGEARQGGLLRGAAGGAAGGAVIGAIAGNAGKGAAIGAVTTTLFGGIRRSNRRSQEQAWQQQQYAQAQQQQQQMQQQAQRQMQNYNRAFSACMSARNYRVQ